MLREGAVRKSRFTEDQMVRILREDDTESVPKVAKRHGVSEQTIYTRRKRYGELEVSDVRRPARRPCSMTIAWPTWLPDRSSLRRSA